MYHEGLLFSLLTTAFFRPFPVFLVAVVFYSAFDHAKPCYCYKRC